MKWIYEKVLINTLVFEEIIRRDVWVCFHRSYNFM